MLTIYFHHHENFLSDEKLDKFSFMDNERNFETNVWYKDKLWIEIRDITTQWHLICIML